MHLIMCGDIIYNLLLQSKLPDIINLSEINKTFYKVSNDNHLWHNKLIKDYCFVKNLMSNNLKKEYINIYKSVIIANNLVNVLLILDPLVLGENIPDIFLRNDNINIKNMYWLPKYLINVINNNDIIYDNISPNISFCDIDVNGCILVLKLFKKDSIQRYKYHWSITKTKFVQFLTLLYYHYPNHYSYAGRNGPFFYKNLINNISVLTNKEKYILDCWRKVLSKVY